jgi:hypothetical protein
LKYLKISDNYYLNVNYVDNFFIEKDEQFELWHIFAENIKGKNFWNISNESKTELEAQKKLKYLIWKINEGVICEVTNE